MLEALIAACVVAGLGLIGIGWAAGLRRALTVSQDTVLHLRQQIAHMTGAPPPEPARAGNVWWPDFGKRQERKDAA